jgi:hypothetical protein
MSVNIYDPNTDTLTKVAGRGEVPGNVITSDSFKSGNSTTETHDANEMTTNGVYYYTSNGPDSSVGATSTDGAMFVQAYNDTWVAQIAQDYRTGKAFFRGRNDGVWTAWQAFKSQADVDSAYSSGRTQGQADRDEGVTLDSESRLLSDYKARTSDGTLVTGNIASKSSGASCTTYGVDGTGPYVYFAAGYYPSVNSTYGAFVRLTAAQIKAMANSAGVGYDAGRTQGRNDVKNSPNSYGLYTATQYNNNYNSGRTSVKWTLTAYLGTPNGTQIGNFKATKTGKTLTAGSVYTDHDPSTPNWNRAFALVSFS